MKTVSLRRRLHFYLELAHYKLKTHCCTYASQRGSKNGWTLFRLHPSKRQSRRELLKLVHDWDIDNKSSRNEIIFSVAFKSKQILANKELCVGKYWGKKVLEDLISYLVIRALKIRVNSFRGSLCGPLEVLIEDFDCSLPNPEANTALASQTHTYRWSQKNANQTDPLLSLEVSLLERPPMGQLFSKRN